MIAKDWIESDLGRWVIGRDGRSLVLDVAGRGGDA
jgi:hypothetical protein